MQSQTVDGIGSIMGGEYEQVSISGVGTSKGDITVKELEISGVFKGKGMVKAGRIHCEGVGEFSENIRANNIYIDGVMKVSNRAKLEAEEVVCDGCLTINSELSTDKLVVDGFIKAKEIFGEVIIINSVKGNKGLGKKFTGVFLVGIGDLFTGIKGFNNGGSQVDLIEATNITLRNVRAKQVNGANITIGENCVIENVDCTGSLRVHNTAIVRNITGASVKEKAAE